MLEPTLVEKVMVWNLFVTFLNSFLASVSHPHRTECHRAWILNKTSLGNLDYPEVHHSSRKEACSLPHEEIEIGRNRINQGNQSLAFLCTSRWFACDKVKNQYLCNTLSIE